MQSKEDAMTNACPLCCQPGKVLRKREAMDLSASYFTYFQSKLPDDIVRKYFLSPVIEFLCRKCAIRYYQPCNLGEGDFYDVLGKLFPWYYGSESWDKRAAFNYLKTLGKVRVVEVGCGTGAFLECLRDNKIECMGIDLNGKAVEEARAKGLAAYLPSQLPEVTCDVLCMFQTIEHVESPVSFLLDYIQQLRPINILLSAPCFESLLGHTSDPLSWPPHHATCWSARAFRVLAERVNRKVIYVQYDSLDYRTFQDRQMREISGRISGLPRLPPNRFGKLLFAILQSMGFNWSNRCHSIIVVMH